MKPPLTAGQAAALIGVKPVTMRVWRQRGDGPTFIQPSGKWGQAFYDEADVQKFKREYDKRRTKCQHT
jgi:predicted site-specific integrase-resolvase